MFSVHSAVTRETPSGLLFEIVKGTPIRFLYRDGMKRLGVVHEVNRTRNFATIITIQTVRGYKNYRLHDMTQIEKVM